MIKVTLDIKGWLDQTERCASELMRVSATALHGWMDLQLILLPVCVVCALDIGHVRAF